MADRVNIDTKTSEIKMDSSPEENLKKRNKSRSLSTDKAAKNFLAPFLKRIKRPETHTFISEIDESYHKRNLRSKIKEVVSKLTSFCKDSLELPTVLNETSEILKEVTKSAGVSSFMVDESNKYLTMTSKYMPDNGRHTVKYKIEPGKTVSSFVAFSKEFVMVDDVLGDERFPGGVSGGQKTVKSVLCVPVPTSVDGKCVAVIELYREINQDPYTALDLQICVAMTGWMGAAIHQNYERMYLLKKSELNNYLTSLVEFFFAGALSFDKFIADLIECSKVSVQAERGSFYVMEEEVPEGTEGEIVADVYEEGIDSTHAIFKKKSRHRFSKGSLGFVNRVAREGKIINLGELNTDSQAEITDFHRDFVTRSMIGVPLKGSLGILGVLQLTNKLEGPFFTTKDESLLRNIAEHACLACQHACLKEQIRKSQYRTIGNQELIKIQMKPCPDDLRYLRSEPPLRKSDMPKGFFDFHWIVTGKEEQAPKYAVFMFFYLLGEQYFDYNNLTEFVLTARKSYRDNPYHNFAHAFTVCHCVFNVLHRNKSKFTKLQILALMISTMCHDSDHVGYTNNFLEMTDHWLAQLYRESPLEHHHYYVCNLITEGSGVLSNLNSTERAEVDSLMRALILSTDLVQYFRNRVEAVNLIKTKAFDWDNANHRHIFLGMLMTVCDVSGQCKPFYAAKKVTEGLYKEFYNQGDVEKNLGFSPLSMMDREKTATIPENQIQFLSLVCIPSVEILVSVFPNTEELLTQCVELRDCWYDIQAKKVIEVWKVEDCLRIGTSRKISGKKVVLG